MNLHLMEACLILAATRELVALVDPDRRIKRPEANAKPANPHKDQQTPLSESAGRTLLLLG